MSNFLKSNLDFLKVLNNASNEKVGEDTGIGKKFRNYAVGKNEPSLNDLIKISNYFNVSIDDLLKKNMKESGLKSTVEEPPVKYNVSRKLAEMESQIRQLSELIKKGEKGK